MKKVSPLDPSCQARFVRALIFGIHQNEVKAKGGPEHQPIKDRQCDVAQIDASSNSAVFPFQPYKPLKH
jgi:hypothetical protein